jgi:hypothetical protein
MAAPSHRSRTPARSTGRSAQARLPWWALALPLAAFAALLMLPLSGSGTAGESAGTSSVSQVLDRVQAVLARG